MYVQLVEPENYTGDTSLVHTFKHTHVSIKFGSSAVVLWLSSLGNTRKAGLVKSFIGPTILLGKSLDKLLGPAPGQQTSPAAAIDFGQLRLSSLPPKIHQFYVRNVYTSMFYVGTCLCYQKSPLEGANGQIRERHDLPSHSMFRAKKKCFYTPGACKYT